MDGLYLYCMVCHNYVGGCDCGCGWKNDYPENREVDIEDLIRELSDRLQGMEPDEFEDVLDKLRGDYERC